MILDNPIICALDMADLDSAVKLASDLKGVVGAVKLGLEFFTSYGPDGVRDITDIGIPVFLDLKLHDIPNTVAGAMRGIAELGVFMTTVHISAGKDILKAAVDTANDTFRTCGKQKPLVIGVTVLTSMDDADLRNVGVERQVDSQVSLLADLARDVGLDGCVCSSHEIGRLRDNLAHDLKLIVPGIRPRGCDTDDQKRIMTPEEAMRQGADYLVIGRPITRAKNPISAAEKIAESII